MFFGRKTELSVLEDTYKKPGFQMTVIYGQNKKKWYYNTIVDHW